MFLTFHFFMVVIKAAAKLIEGFSNTLTIYIAAEFQGQTAAVEFLLLNGAKINVLDEKLNTPLHLAAAEGNTLWVTDL